MAHFAQLDEASFVTQVIVVDNNVVDNLPFPESEPIGVAFCQSLLGSNTIWKQTSYNASFRKNWAIIGSIYDSTLDAFIWPCPGPGWVLNPETCRWEYPSPPPPVLDGQPPEVI